MCPKIELTKNLILNTTETFIGTQVLFTCPVGYNISGEQAVLCRDDGEKYRHTLQLSISIFLATWSSPSPSCLPIQCTALEIRSSHLRVLTLNNSYHGVATFDCPFGYRLTGRESITCEGGGAWSGLVPECEGTLQYVLCLAVIHVLCSYHLPLPSSPSAWLPGPHLWALCGDHCAECVQHWLCAGGRACHQVHAGRYLVTRHAPVWVLDRRVYQVPIYTHVTGVRACPYPGAPPQGRITPIKFVYSVGDHISVVCSEGLFVAGTTSVHCTKEGVWSDIVPFCQDYVHWGDGHVKRMCYVEQELKW